MKINSIAIVFIASLYFGSVSFGQSWDSANGNFNGTGDFTATETSDPWVGPGLFADRGGELTFVGDAEHNGSTFVGGATSVLVDGSFNHTNSFQNFAVRGGDGQGGFSSMTIGDVENSNVNSADFDLQFTGLSLNSAIADGSVLVRDGAVLDILQDFSSGGSTFIADGAQAIVGGAFNHTNSFQNFAVRGTDGQGGFSSLTIGDVENSNVTSADFDLQFTGLSLNSAIADGSVLVRNGAVLDILQDFSSGGSTFIADGAQAIVGGSFNHTNSFQTFAVRGTDGQGGFSSLTIGDVENSNVNSADFDLQFTGLNLNSVIADGSVLVRNGAVLDILQDFSSGGSTFIADGAQAIVGGSFNHTNSFQTFAVRGTDGQGGFSSLTIGDVENSNVTSADFDLQYTGLNLNSVIADGSVLVRNGAVLEILQDFSSGGSTFIAGGAQAIVGGAFNHTNSFQTFAVRGTDGQGGFSSLTIGDVANSNVTSSDFDLQFTELNLNSVAATTSVLVRDEARLDVLQDLSSGGSTGIAGGAQVTIGGDFTQANANQNFAVSGADFFGNRSSFEVGGTVDIEARSFTSSGRTEFAGEVKTAIDAIFFGDSTIAPGTSVGEMNFDTVSIATESHGVEINSGATYEWELGADGNDVINVDGDLRLSDNWELELITLAGAPSNVELTDRFDVFTYTGALTAFVEASGQLSRVQIDDSTVNPDRWDTSQVGIFDDGNGTIYLTGLEFIAVPEPGSGAAILIGLIGFSLRRKRSSLSI